MWYLDCGDHNLENCTYWLHSSIWWQCWERKSVFMCVCVCVCVCVCASLPLSCLCFTVTKQHKRGGTVRNVQPTQICMTNHGATLIWGILHRNFEDCVLISVLLECQYLLSWRKPPHTRVMHFGFLCRKLLLFTNFVYSLNLIFVQLKGRFKESLQFRIFATTS